MLISELLGAVLLLACGVLYPRLCARDRRKALSQIDALISLIGLIRRHIEFYRLPVKEILLRCDKALLSCFGEGRDDLSALFEETDWLDGKVEVLASRFADSLGKGYYAEQLRLCDAVLSELDAIRGECVKKEMGKRKTEGVLSLGAAVLAVILLL